MQEAVDEMVRTISSFEPDPKAVARYQEEFALFRKAYQGLAANGFWAELAAFQSKHSGAL
jgi:sugar (pentulose or hexulose) kinase